MSTVDVTPKPGRVPVYLGDGLYASYDGYQYELYAWDGHTKSSSVYLEPPVLNAFMKYVREIMNHD